MTCTYLAESVGFEPTVSFPTHDFQSRLGRPSVSTGVYTCRSEGVPDPSPSAVDRQGASTWRSTWRSKLCIISRATDRQADNDQRFYLRVSQDYLDRWLLRRRRSRQPRNPFGRSSAVDQPWQLPRAVLVRRRRLVIVSEQDEPGLWGAPSLTLDELARRQHAKPVADLAELAADIWESDEELDAFLVDFRESRDSSLG